MNSRRLLGALCAFTAIICLSALPAKAGTKRFEWTTKSAEAKENAILAIKAIETYKFGPMVLPYAQKAVAADPNFAFGEYLLGTVGAPEESAAHTEKAIQLAKNASEGERRYIEAVQLVRSQKLAEGISILKELETKYPDERLVQTMLGQALFNSGDIPGAQKRFEKAIKLDGSTPRAYGFLGTCFLLTDDYAKARTLFQKSLDRCSADTAPFQPNYGLAFTYVYERNFDEAISILKRYEAQYTKVGGFPGLPAVFIFNSIGRLYLESGRPSEAIEYYKMGYATVPNSTLSDQDKAIWLGRLHHGTGRALARMGKHQDAWKEAETVKQMIENGGEAGKQFWPSYHYIAGYLSYEDGEFKAAIDHMLQAHVADDPFHKLILARSYEKLGDETNAMKVYKEIVESKVNNLERALAYPEAKKRVKA